MRSIRHVAHKSRTQRPRVGGEGRPVNGDCLLHIEPWGCRMAQMITDPDPSGVPHLRTDSPIQTQSFQGMSSATPAMIVITPMIRFITVAGRRSAVTTPTTPPRKLPRVSASAAPHGIPPERCR
jgi:hypothetical protein